MRILICDDDELITEQLSKFIQIFFKQCSAKCPKLCCFFDGESLLADTGEKDILFLDIEMPGINGIFVGNELKKQNKNIIIFVITSFSEYLDDAMRFHVFRYLSKPIDKQRLFRNLKEAIELYNTYTVKLPIETKQGIFTVLASDIIFVEAIERKVIVHTIECDYESIHTMNYWIGQLPKNHFFQSNKSYIINFDYVCDFDHSLIHLFNRQFNAYLTKRKYTKFKEAYHLYLESMR